MSGVIQFPSPSGAVPPDPVKDRLADELVAYIGGDGRPMSVETRREAIAAWLSGAITASSMSMLRAGDRAVVPAVLRAKILEMAADFGLKLQAPPDQVVKATGNLVGP